MNFVEKIEEKINTLKVMPKNKRERVVILISLCLVIIIFFSWFWAIGGFSGYLSGVNSSNNNESLNSPFKIISDIFNDFF